MESYPEEASTQSQQSLSWGRVHTKTQAALPHLNPKINRLKQQDQGRVPTPTTSKQQTKQNNQCAWDKKRKADWQREISRKPHW
jgi:hypothetical protein